jgi:hypothetical protein
MAIKYTKEPTPKFPLLRRYNDNAELVVLFTEEEFGVALSGVGHDRIGKREKWIACSNPIWIPTSINLYSDD